ncbi:BTB/POZ domain-containing protein kctd1, partial [Desmophyllum pertusum]
DANKTLNSYLKHLVNEGKIAGTVHKNPLTGETIQKLYEKGELADADTRDPRVLLQTAWFFVSIYFGKRGRENQSSLKKSMLRLLTTANGEEFFELNKNEPGAVLASKNHTEDLTGLKITQTAKSFLRPVQEDAQSKS